MKPVTFLHKTGGATLLMGCVLLLAGCPEKASHTTIDTGDGTTFASRDFNWNIPSGYPLPVVPITNPLTEEKFQLGKHLFYDPRLSGNGTKACASCHIQSLAFSDGVTRALGSTGMMHPRNSQALVNIAYNASVNWGNPTTVSLEQQAPVPMFGEFPVELGINDDNKDGVLARFKAEPRYAGLFSSAFPGDANPINFDNIVNALASFGRGLNSFKSPFDRHEAGDTTALSDTQIRGMRLFFDEKTECFHCHDGMNFTQSSYDRTQSFADTVFFNNGLYNTDGKGGYPEGGQGIYEITGKAADMGRFRPPTLRNIALTAPYMHDGSLKTLEDVVRHYNAGGRNITAGANAGDGRLNPNKSSFVRPIGMTEQEIQDLVAFLESLTDQDFITNPRFANPWK
ncbi:methanobactin export MATE transporter MbnM [Thiothrix lacustris]|uniref:methanobactin export MATE transporter MbnM n=1 Tax=Thiothrix lacustris TaxID=525917 RepID=UPI0027E4A1AB|nr:methanobactin export MATE transporter MbnM [Thiothrix lacustris]WMP19006.1 di-heme enzyme [Thiothrix lacustris]